VYNTPVPAQKTRFSRVRTERGASNKPKLATFKNAARGHHFQKRICQVMPKTWLPS